MENYKGYRYEADGRYYPADPLQGEQGMFDYLQTHMLSYPAIRILDSEEYIVAEAKGGHIVFPLYLAVVQIREELKKQKAFDALDIMRRLKGSGIELDVPIPSNVRQAEQLLEILFRYYVKATDAN